MTLLPESPDMFELTAGYISGKWVGAGAERIAVTSPATGEVLGSVDVAGPEQVDAAVAAARAALISPPWRDSSPPNGPPCWADSPTR